MFENTFNLLLLDLAFDAVAHELPVKNNMQFHISVLDCFKQ